MMISIPPGILYMVGGLIAMIVPTAWQRVIAVGVALLGGYQLMQLQPTDTWTVSFLNTSIELLRVDALSMVFGYVFVIASFAAFIYGWGVAKTWQPPTKLKYPSQKIPLVRHKPLFWMYKHSI